MHSCKT